MEDHVDEGHAALESYRCENGRSRCWVIDEDPPTIEQRGSDVRKSGFVEINHNQVRPQTRLDRTTIGQSNRARGIQRHHAHRRWQAHPTCEECASIALPWAVAALSRATGALVSPSGVVASAGVRVTIIQSPR